MKEIIASRIEKLKREIEKFFEKDDVRLDEAEVYFTQRIGETVRGLLAACYEQKDAELLADKAGRKEAGLVVERRGDVRQVVTQLGVVSYHRTFINKLSPKKTIFLGVVVVMPVLHPKVFHRPKTIYKLTEDSISGILRLSSGCFFTAPLFYRANSAFARNFPGVIPMLRRNAVEK